MPIELPLKLLKTQSNDILGIKSYLDFSMALSQSNCQKCPLSKSRTNIVVDRGNPDAKIMVIGEAPGENEDLQAKAFIGRAGKLFDQVMASVELDTNRDMFICNVIKCRPPKNRTPNKEEVAACTPFLKKQIELIEPKIIILLGATALKRMSPNKKIISMGNEVGHFFDLPEYFGIKFIVLYHPAALLYNSKLKPAMIEHAKTIKSALNNGLLLL